MSHFACIVKIDLMVWGVLVTSDATVLQMVVWFPVCQQIIIILATSLHVVVCILVESTERVVVIDLVVEAETSFQEGIANIILLLIVNHLQRVSKDGLLELAIAFPSVVSPEEVGK